MKVVFKDKKQVARIIVPILIVIAVAAIYLIKNPPFKTEADESSLLITEIDLDSMTEAGLPIMIDFGADYCAPCKQMEPILESVSREMQGKASIHYLDIEKYPETAMQYPVQVIPTQVFFLPDGSPYMPDEQLGIPFTLYSSRETGEHVLTVHEGFLTEEQMKLILSDMGVEE